LNVCIKQLFCTHRKPNLSVNFYKTDSTETFHTTRKWSSW